MVFSEDDLKTNGGREDASTSKNDSEIQIHNVPISDCWDLGDSDTINVDSI